MGALSLDSLLFLDFFLPPDVVELLSSVASLSPLVFLELGLLLRFVFVRFLPDEMSAICQKRHGRVTACIVLTFRVCNTIRDIEFCINKTMAKSRTMNIRSYK